MPNKMFYKPAPIYPYKEAQSIINSESYIDTNAVDNRNFIEDDVKTINIQDTFDTTLIEKGNNKKEKNSREFFTFDKNALSIFGFSINIDDLIIIAIIIFLFFENKKDYLLLIVLGLMLFDISIDSLKNMNIIKQLFNPT
jgi:hypothetical protein